MKIILVLLIIASLVFSGCVTGMGATLKSGSAEVVAFDKKGNTAKECDFELVYGKKKYVNNYEKMDVLFSGVTGRDGRITIPTTKSTDSDTKRYILKVICNGIVAFEPKEKIKDGKVYEVHFKDYVQPIELNVKGDGDYEGGVVRTVDPKYGSDTSYVFFAYNKIFSEPGQYKFNHKSVTSDNFNLYSQYIERYAEPTGYAAFTIEDNGDLKVYDIVDGVADIDVDKSTVYSNIYTEDVSLTLKITKKAGDGWSFSNVIMYECGPNKVSIVPEFNLVDGVYETKEEIALPRNTPLCADFNFEKKLKILTTSKLIQVGDGDFTLDCNTDHKDGDRKEGRIEKIKLKCDFD